MHEPWSPPTYSLPLQGFSVVPDFEDSSIDIKNVFEPRAFADITDTKAFPFLQPRPLPVLQHQPPLSPLQRVDSHELSDAPDFSPHTEEPSSPVPQAWSRRFSESSSGSDRPLRRYSFDVDAYKIQRRQSVQSQGPVLSWLRKATLFLLSVFDEADPLVDPEEEGAFTNLGPGDLKHELESFELTTRAESFTKSTPQSYRNTSTIEDSDSDSETPMEIISTTKRVYGFITIQAHALALFAMLTAVPLSSHMLYTWLQSAVIGAAVLMGPTITAGFYPVLGVVSLGYMVNLPAQVCALGLLLWLAREWHKVEIIRKSKI